jgi:hypothetical protein
MAGPLESGVSNGSDKMEHAPTMKDVYSAENEVHTPTKEEMETNEKNLQQSAAYLGQLVFKLRFDPLNFTSCQSTNLSTSTVHTGPSIYFYFADISTTRTP